MHRMFRVRLISPSYKLRGLVPAAVDLSVDDYIEIVRILHAARDIEAILEQQEGE